MKGFDLWLQNSLRYDELKKCLEKAVAFYGEYMGNALLQHDLTLLLNDKRTRRLGCFSPYEITLYDTRNNMHKYLDCVFVHELAHFLDRIRTIEESCYKHATSFYGTKERTIAELFRNNMTPCPESRRRYRGRTCECFARAIEEYYALKTNNTFWLDEHRDFDYYVNFEVFENMIYPVVENYINSL